MRQRLAVALFVAVVLLPQLPSQASSRREASFVREFARGVCSRLTKRMVKDERTMMKIGADIAFDMIERGWNPDDIVQLSSDKNIIRRASFAMIDECPHKFD